MGKSKVSINPIGLGTGTGFGFESIRKDNEIIYLINSAIDFGMNFFDTAEAYFKGHSEELLGKALKGKRSKAIIASKFSPEHSVKKLLIKALDGSLRRLKSDYIDLYQIHWPNLSVPLEETLSVLETEVKKGKIRFIGVSNFSFRQILKTMKYLKQHPLSSVQNEYNLLERAVEDQVLSICQRKSVTFIAYNPLGNWPFKKRSLLNTLIRMAKKYNKTPVQIMLNWLVNKSNTVAIPCTTSIEHLRENAESSNFSIEKEDLATLENAFCYRVENVPISKIAIPKDLNTYHTVDDAIKNTLNSVPSPAKLSLEIKTAGGFLKPIKLKKKGKTFELSDGKIRFWAWVLAYGGKKSIPAIIE